jgi:hypothetical protein
MTTRRVGPAHTDEGVSSDLPTYRDYIADTAVAARVGELNRFSYTIRFQQAGLTDPAMTDDILSACLASLARILPAAEIHNLHLLKATVQQPEWKQSRLDERRAIVTVSLKERRNGFSLTVYDDRITIARDSSSFEDFYRWYCDFMPQAGHADATIRRAIERRLNTQLILVETQYEFKFDFSDFTRTGQSLPGTGQSLPVRRRNVDVLEYLVPAVPTDAGRVELSKQDFYRLDISFSRLDEFIVDGRSRLRNCWYSLEAPFNENGRFIVFTAQLRNTSNESLSDTGADGRNLMIPFDADFADDYQLALVGFLRDRALEGFMGRLFETWDFSTQRDI